MARKTKYEIPEVIEREILRPKAEQLIEKYVRNGKEAWAEVEAANDRKNAVDKIIIYWYDEDDVLNELEILLEWDTESQKFLNMENIDIIDDLGFFDDEEE